MLVVDLLHEFELGVWKALFTHLIRIGNVTGYPGVFQINPHPYPSKPVPAATGMGFDGYGLWVL